MDISVFSSYVKHMQNHGFSGKSKADFLDEFSQQLYSIRSAQTEAAIYKRQMDVEKKRKHPRPLELARLRVDILRTIQPAVNTMDSINKVSQNSIGADIFTLSGTNAMSSTVRNEFGENSKRYMQSLYERILRDPSRIPEGKRNSPYEDRKYIESFFRDEEIRERVRNRPEPPPEKEWSAEQRAQSLGNRFLKEGAHVLENTSNEQKSRQKSRTEKRKEDDLLTR